MSKNSSGIMLVDDPKNTILALCDIKSEAITKNLYKTNYEKIIGRKNEPISRQHTDTHFYALKQFKLILPHKMSKYRVSQTVFDLCDSLERENEENYKKLLRSIILNSEKGELFDEFLNTFNSKRLSKNELSKIFKPFPTKTLIAWCYEAGFIDKGKEKYWKINLNKKSPSLSIFLKTLKEVYCKMRRNKILGLQRVYIEIDEIRDAVSANLEIKKESFDSYLSQALEKGKSRIRIHGAPPEQKKNTNKNFLFEHKEKVYHYLSIE